MIEVSGLTKVYGELTAVSHLDLTIDQGEVFGFLGPNGAGKTTTIKMLVGLLAPTEGTATIKGFDVADDPIGVKEVLGYLPDEPFLYDYLTPREFLRFLGDVRKVENADKKIEELLARFDLDNKADEYCADLSHGMKKKLAFAGAILHSPALAILDEPTSGLDPLSVRKFRETVRKLAAEGTTVFLSTHILEIAEALCTRVGIINRGRLVAVGTPKELKERAQLGESNLEDLFIELTVNDKEEGDKE